MEGRDTHDRAEYADRNGQKQRVPECSVACGSKRKGSVNALAQ